MRGRKEGKTPIVCANESCRSFSRAFFGSIPEDFGNRGESTITKLPTRNKQWQKHHKKDQTTGNRMTVCVRFLFHEVGTAIWLQEFYHGNLLLKQKWSNSRGHIIAVLRRKSLKKTASFDSPRFSLSYGVLLPSFIHHW